MNDKKIKKAIIAAAGYGTRFLPATKVQPKEMLPIIDKPIIQYLVEEAVESGIRDIIIVTRAGSQLISDHFDSNFELETKLAEAGKTTKLKQIQDLPKLANFIYLRQSKNYPYGNASPLLAAKDLIDDRESFIYMFGDDLVLAQEPAIKQLIELWHRNQKAWIVACQEVPAEEVDRYGILKLKNGSQNEIKSVVEKPKIVDSPSNLAQFGRFILDKRIFNYLGNQTLGKDNELWLTDAISEHAKKNIVLCKKITGEWLTTGDPLNYLKATIHYASKRPDLSEPFFQFLKNFIKEQK